MSGIASRTVDREVLEKHAKQAISAVESANRWEKIFQISAVGFGLLSVIGTLYLSRSANRGNPKKLPVILYPLVGGALGVTGLFAWSHYRAKEIAKAEERLNQDFEKLEEDDEDTALEVAQELYEELGDKLPHLLKFVESEELDQDELDELLSRAALDSKTHGVANKRMKWVAAVGGGSIAAITLLFALLAATRRATLSRAILLLGSLLPIACGAGYCASAAAGTKRRQKSETKLLARGLKGLQGDADELIAQLEEFGEGVTELKLVVPEVTYKELGEILKLCPKLTSLTVRSELAAEGGLPSLTGIKLESLRIKGKANWPVEDLANLPRQLKRLELAEYLPQGATGSLGKHKALRHVSLGICNDAGLKQLLQLPKLKKLKLGSLDGLDHPELLYKLPGSVDKVVLPALPKNSKKINDPLKGVRTLRLTDPDVESVEHFQALPRLTKIKLDSGFCLRNEEDLNWMKEWHMLDELKVKNFWASFLEERALEEVYEFCVFYISGCKAYLKRDELGKALEIHPGRVVTIKRLHPYGG